MDREQMPLEAWTSPTLFHWHSHRLGMYATILSLCRRLVHEIREEPYSSPLPWNSLGQFKFVERKEGGNPQVFIQHPSRTSDVQEVFTRSEIENCACCHVERDAQHLRRDKSVAVVRCCRPMEECNRNALVAVCETTTCCYFWRQYNGCANQTKRLSFYRNFDPFFLRLPS